MGTFFYTLLAFLIGVLAGWFVWGRLRGELDSLRGDLDRTRSERDSLRAESDRLTGELDACGRARSDLERRLGETQATRTGATNAAVQAPAALMSTSAPAKPAPAKPASRKPAAARTAAGSNARASKTVATPKKAAPARKAALAGKSPASKSPASKAVAGEANNLRRLIGVGPVNERLLNGLGVTTYAQIAAWTVADIKRIEDVLNFDGRIERERWIEQAKLLAAGDEKEFATRFPSAGTASNT
jgi:predicted flap endonuclease-1-like 5' DNA nuclease